MRSCVHTRSLDYEGFGAWCRECVKKWKDGTNLYICQICTDSYFEERMVTYSVCKGCFNSMTPSEAGKWLRHGTLLNQKKTLRQYLEEVLEG